MLSALGPHRNIAKAPLCCSVQLQKSTWIESPFAVRSPCAIFSPLRCATKLLGNSKCANVPVSVTTITSRSPTSGACRLQLPPSIQIAPSGISALRASTKGRVSSLVRLILLLLHGLLIYLSREVERTFVLRSKGLHRPLIVGPCSILLDCVVS